MRSKYTTIIWKTLSDEGLVTEEILPKPHASSLKELKNSVFDTIFITTKIHTSLQVLHDIQAYWIHSKHISVIQNGLVPKNYFNEKDISIVSVYEWFKLDLKHGVLSRLSNDRGRTSSSKYISQLLSSCWIRVNDDISNVWRTIKLLYNGTLNALSALENKTLWELFEDQKIIWFIKLLFDEIYAVLSCFQSWLWDKQGLWDSLESLCTWSLKNHYSSTHEDYTNWKPTEIDFLNWYICNLWENLSIKTPISKYLNDCIKWYSEYSTSYLLSLYANS